MDLHLPDLIFHEDPHWLVLCKPAGLVSQQLRPGDDTLEARLKRYLAPGELASPYLGTVHRLDRPVSGVMVWAKNPRAARRLSDQFARRQARKEYWAVVAGGPSTDEGVWTDWLCIEDTGLKRVQVCHPDTPRAQQAITRFGRLPTNHLPEASQALALWPETGRMHQLRTQSANRGWPILGDDLYRSSRTFPAGIALHARALTIRHPVTGNPWCFEAPPPPSWREAGIEIQCPDAPVALESDPPGRRINPC
jgi:23S rRNA pseudouridine1911/1915/1917 synthase